MTMKQKKTYLEIIRIIAIFLVIYVHTGTDGAEHYQIAGNAFSYCLSLVMYCLAQISVPLFFMVSGAVLLHKKETLKDVLIHRASRILGLILVFGFVQYVYFYFLNPEIGFSLSVYFKLVYSTTVITQFWYLYTYFAFMLILPFVRMLAVSMKKEHFLYLFGLQFLLNGLLPIVEYIWGNSRIVLSVPLLEGVLFYPLMGYFLEHQSDEFFCRKKILVFTNLFGIMAVITNTVVAFMAHRQRGGAETLEGMTAAIALVLFLDLHALARHVKVSYRLQRVICFLGSGVFGVYLLEPPLRDSFRFIYVALKPYISWFPACALWIFSAMFCGVLIFHIFKKIPVLKKLF